MSMSDVLKHCIALAIAIAAESVFSQQLQLSDANSIEEIVVTGSYVGRPNQTDAIAPLNVIGHEDFAALGVNEVSDVVDRLPFNTGSQNNPDAFTQNLSTGTTNVNLRGLGVGATLVLINGRRQTPSAITTDRGDSFVDMSSLPPLIAIDRLEILKDGATAVYGSDAVAGVVNLITRENFYGLDLQAEFQAATQYSQADRQISGLFGTGNDSTHLLAAFSSLRRDSVNAGGRRLSTPTEDLSQSGNPGSFLLPGRPNHPIYGPLWTSAFDGNRNGVADALEPMSAAVPQAQLPLFADPDCAAIAAHDPRVVPGFVASAPSPSGAIPIGLCRFDFGDFYSLVPAETRHSGYVALRSDLGQRLLGQLEYHVARNQAERSNSPSFPFSTFPEVPATHPDNPFGTEVRYVGRLQGSGGAATESLHDSDTRRIAASLSSEVNDAWRWELGIQHSVNEFVVVATDVLADRFNLAINGLGGSSCSVEAGTGGGSGCLYFNPFGTALTGAGTPNSGELLTHLSGLFHVEAASELVTVDAVVTGRWRNGGGIAIGGQRRQEQLSYRYDENTLRDNFMFFTGSTDFAGSRDILALFAELSLPLSDRLESQFAARVEDYGGGLLSTDPKIALLWRPHTSLAVRTSYGSSFRAPSLFQSAGTQTSLAELIDSRVGVPQFFPVRARLNPSGDELRPERADTLHFSVTWNPAAAFEISTAYWAFDYDDVIIQQNPQAILDAARAGEPQAKLQIERDSSSGSLLRVDAYYDNAATLKTDGIDLSVSYERETSRAGILRAGATATRISSYDALDPQVGRINGAGRRNFSNFATSVPTLRGNLYVNWRKGSHGVNFFLNYIGSYLDDETQAGRDAQPLTRIDDYLTVDAQYTLRTATDGSVTLSLGAMNLFDATPPHVATNGGYDSKVHDPRGRLLYARARLAF